MLPAAFQNLTELVPKLDRSSVHYRPESPLRPDSGPDEGVELSKYHQIERIQGPHLSNPHLSHTYNNKTKNNNLSRDHRTF